MFFLSEPVAFRRVYGLESYSRTSGESNHHRQSVSDVKNAAIPTEPRGRLRDEGEAMQRITRVVQYNRPVMGLPCWPLPLFFLVGGEWGGKPAMGFRCWLIVTLKKLVSQLRAWATCTGITSRGSPTLVIAAVSIVLLKPILCHFCLCGSSCGAESSRWRGCGEVCYGISQREKWHLRSYSSANLLAKHLRAAAKFSWLVPLLGPDDPTGPKQRPVFFPSNARWLSPGRLARSLSSRKNNCILQIHRIPPKQRPNRRNENVIQQNWGLKRGLLVHMPGQRKHTSRCWRKYDPISSLRYRN